MADQKQDPKRATLVIDRAETLVTVTLRSWMEGNRKRWGGELIADEPFDDFKAIDGAALKFSDGHVSQVGLTTHSDRSLEAKVEGQSSPPPFLT